jgi:hypothetical protein
MISLRFSGTPSPTSRPDQAQLVTQKLPSIVHSSPVLTFGTGDGDSFSSSSSVLSKRTIELLNKNFSEREIKILHFFLVNDQSKVASKVMDEEDATKSEHDNIVLKLGSLSRACKKKSAALKSESAASKSKNDSSENMKRVKNMRRLLRSR